MVPDASKVALIVLGAGRGSRFVEGDKLGTELRRKPVAHHVLSAVSPFRWGRKILVHHGLPNWSELFAEHGFELIENTDQENGMLSSLHLGAEAASGFPKSLICLADMPLIESTLIASLLERSAETGKGAVASRSGDYRGPPAVFARHLLHSLPKSGEGGARGLLKDAVFVDCDAKLLRDIDTMEDLQYLAQG